MSNPERLIKTGDPVEHLGSWALEIDRHLAEIARLYVDLSIAQASGNMDAFKAIHQEILTLKAQLNQL